LEEYGVNLLLQGGDHGKELFLAGWWWWLAGRALEMLLLVVVVVRTWCLMVVVMVMEKGMMTCIWTILGPGLSTRGYV